MNAGVGGTWNQAGRGKHMGWGRWGLVLLPRELLSLPHPALAGFRGWCAFRPPRSPRASQTESARGRPSFCLSPCTRVPVVRCLDLCATQEEPTSLLFLPFSWAAGYHGHPSVHLRVAPGMSAALLHACVAVFFLLACGAPTARVS